MTTLLSRFHYVPKHASWLNMVEIEIGVLRSRKLVKISLSIDAGVAMAILYLLATTL